MLQDLKEEKYKLECELADKLIALEKKYGVTIEDIHFDKIEYGRVAETQPSNIYEIEIKVSI